MSVTIKMQGSTLSYNDGTTAQVITGLKTLTFFDGEVSESDVTTLESEAMEFDPGLADWGNVTASGNYYTDDDGQNAIDADYGTGVVREMIWTLTNGVTWTFNAFIKSRAFNGEVNGRAQVDFTFRVTGKPVKATPP